ncbi:hypothetical protein EVAR_102718_1 [Eumeta japonica]|uniref:Uncharacterized protein n=1 Tax=Eumeta variegata TaxID=151549 RepID=A0A4C1TIX6_EUMVA|nr:hypothetical protein EVAR_102718_1 [Eumeta japonica]
MTVCGESVLRKNRHGRRTTPPAPETTTADGGAGRGRHGAPATRLRAYITRVRSAVDVERSVGQSIQNWVRYRLKRPRGSRRRKQVTSSGGCRQTRDRRRPAPGALSPRDLSPRSSAAAAILLGGASGRLDSCSLRPRVLAPRPGRADSWAGAAPTCRRSREHAAALATLIPALTFRASALKTEIKSNQLISTPLPTQHRPCARPVCARLICKRRRGKRSR